MLGAIVYIPGGQKVKGLQDAKEPKKKDRAYWDWFTVMGGWESLSKTDGKHRSDTWTNQPTNQGDYIASRTKAKATDLSRLIQILVDEQFEQL